MRTASVCCFSRARLFSGWGPHSLQGNICGGWGQRQKWEEQQICILALHSRLVSIYAYTPPCKRHAQYSHSSQAKTLEEGRMWLGRDPRGRWRGLNGHIWFPGPKVPHLCSRKGIMCQNYHQNHSFKTMKEVAYLMCSWWPDPCTVLAPQRCSFSLTSFWKYTGKRNRLSSNYNWTRAFRGERDFKVCNESKSYNCILPASSHLSLFILANFNFISCPLPTSPSAG